jgi:hypothetical protein
MPLANLARAAAVIAACLAAVGSATSNNQNASMMTQQGQPGGNPPPPQAMEAGRALGLWRSTFGAVKLEADPSRGGLQAGAVHGVWTYQRQGQEVIGYFHGQLRGNVLQFQWQEPSNPPLVGAGYLVFDPQGRQYTVRWWTEARDRIGDWNGWRHAPPQSADPYAGYGQPAGGYGGAGYGDPYGGQPGGQYGGQPYGGHGPPPPPGPRGPQHPGGHPSPPPANPW